MKLKLYSKSEQRHVAKIASALIKHGDSITTATEKVAKKVGCSSSSVYTWYKKWSGTFGESVDAKTKQEVEIELTGKRKLIYDLLLKSERQDRELATTNTEIVRLIASR